MNRERGERTPSSTVWRILSRSAKVYSEPDLPGHALHTGADRRSLTAPCTTHRRARIHRLPVLRAGRRSRWLLTWTNSQCRRGIDRGPPCYPHDRPRRPASTHALSRLGCGASPTISSTPSPASVPRLAYKVPYRGRPIDQRIQQVSTTDTGRSGGAADGRRRRFSGRTLPAHLALGILSLSSSWSTVGISPSRCSVPCTSRTPTPLTSSAWRSRPRLTKPRHRRIDPPVPVAATAPALDRLDCLHRPRPEQ